MKVKTSTTITDRQTGIMSYKVDAQLLNRYLSSTYIFNNIWDKLIYPFKKLIYFAEI